MQVHMCGLLLLFVVLAGVARSDDSPQVGAGERDTESLRARGYALEKSHEFLTAASLYEEAAVGTPRRAEAFWKVARNLWRHAESLPIDSKQERLVFFERANTWATRGLKVDPDCAECMLWKFSAMGRIGTTRGVLSSLRSAPEMRDLLVRGIELQPTHQDDLTNSTLGNLYYAGAVFYRIVPDWALLGWTLGVKGDLDTSLEMIEHAVAISDTRIDYQVEKGAILLCMADKRSSEDASGRGRGVLNRALTLEQRIGTDAIDIEHARVLLREPENACGYSRDGWIEVDDGEDGHAEMLQ
jgi:hypothetical protein